MPKPVLTLHHLKATLLYRPLTGEFIWAVAVTNYEAGDEAGVVYCSGYSNIRIDKRTYLAHRLAWFYTTGAWPVKDLDHIDGNRLNNAFHNLREATPLQNAANRNLAVGGQRSHTWVMELPSGQYMATIKYKGELRFLGEAPSFEGAVELYQAAHIALHGDYSVYRRAFMTSNCAD